MEEKTRLLGKININPLVQTFGEIQTEEVIITYERIDHIMERHPQDYEIFLDYGVFTITDPDFIIKDGKYEGTIFYDKKACEYKYQCCCKNCIKY